MENAKVSVCNKLAYHNLAVHFSVNPIGRTSSKSCKDWTEQIFSIYRRINDFFPLYLLSFNSSKHAKHVWFLLVNWWSHATFPLARLHIISQCTKFCSLPSQFFRAFQSFPKALTRLASWHCFGIVSSPFSSTDLIQFTALFSVQYNLASFLALGRGRSFAIFFASFGC